MEIRNLKLNDLKLKLPKYADQVELFIEGDYNDADFVTETSFLDIDRYKKGMVPVLKKLQNHGTIIAVNDEPSVTPEEIESVSCYFPTAGDTEEIHSIESIKCWFLSKKDHIRYEIEL